MLRCKYFDDTKDAPEFKLLSYALLCTNLRKNIFAMSIVIH